MKIRSITIFADLQIPLGAAAIAGLGDFANLARQAYTDAGFEVQTTRLALDIFPALRQSGGLTSLLDIAIALEGAGRDHGFEYVTLGPCPREGLAYVPEMLAATQSIFVTTHMVDSVTGVIDGEAIRAAVGVIRAASHIANANGTFDGFGNLRFAALANVPPRVPFFPAAYHDGGSPAFAIATESADMAVEACADAPDAAVAHRRLRDAITDEAARVAGVADQLVRDHSMRFHGIDFSLAPFPTPACSIGGALEALTGQPLGAAGTLAAAATLTDAIGQAQFPHIGFCGLMLPVLEDSVLGQRAAEGRLNVGELLQWSAVCGTGLDTVPLPGDASESALARLLFDVAALSVRLHKPLTARLMPLPGKVVGDPVHFDFAYFADGGVLALNGPDHHSPIEQTKALFLHARGV